MTITSDLVFHFKDYTTTKNVPAIQNGGTYTASILEVFQYRIRVSLLLCNSSDASISYQIEMLLPESSVEIRKTRVF